MGDVTKAGGTTATYPTRAREKNPGKNATSPGEWESALGFGQRCPRFPPERLPGST